VNDVRWLGRAAVLAMHADQIDQHSGLGGTRDANLLESALNRAPMRLHYKPDADLPELGAAYGFAIATSHPFLDGNKRTAFMCMYTFLGLNQVRINASEPEAVEIMMGVASGTIDEAVLADWLRAHTQPRV
jgi:death on curing protein